MKFCTSKSCFFSIIFLFLFFVDAYAEHLGIPEIKYIDRRQYQGGMQNWKISQSKYDLMYVANSEGILEFDGVRWDLYRPMSDLRSRCVKCIGDYIYTGTYNDFGYFKYDSLQQLSFVSLAENERMKDFGDVWEVHEWNGYVVFMMTQAVVFLKDNKVVHIIDDEARFRSSFVVNGRLLICDVLSGIKEVRGEKLFYIPFGKFFEGMTVSSIIPMADGSWVITTLRSGIYRYNYEGLSPWKFPAEKYLLESNVSCGLRYNDDYLVFGTLNKGLYITDNKGNLVMHLNKNMGLGDDNVISLLVDREGILWATLNNGIVSINFNSSVSYLTDYYNLGAGFAMDHHKGKWYFGTNQGLYSITDSEFRNPLKDKNSFTNIEAVDGQVWSLFTDEDNVLCGHTSGVYEIIGDKGHLISPPYIIGFCNFNKVPGHDDLLLCGTYVGLVVLKKERGRWHYYKKYNNYFKSSRFLQQGSGLYWWATDGKSEVFRLRFSPDYESIDEVKLFEADALYDDNSFRLTKIGGDLIVLGENGMYTPQGQGFEKYIMLDDYLKGNDNPVNILEDEYKNLWVFYRQKIEALEYTEEGTYHQVRLPFVSLDMHMISGYEMCYVDNAQSLFFGVEDGFAHYRMDEKLHLSPFKVHLTSFEALEDSVVYTLLQSEDNPQTVIPEFAYRYNTFEANYAAPLYRGDHIEFSTCLSPSDDEFSEWSEKSYRQLVLLKEGDYEFKIKARCCAGVETETLIYKFSVLPPWHRTLLARVGYGLLVILFVILLFVIINRKVENGKRIEKEKQLEYFKKKEEKLLSETLRAEKEVIKMRNDKLRSEMLYKEKELANSSMSIIQKNEFMTGVKERLRTLKKLSIAPEVQRGVESVIRKIDKDIGNDKYWQVFELHLENVHEDFLHRLKAKHPELSSKDEKLSAYIRMGMTSKEIASLMNISSRAVDNMRYHLRQKLLIDSGDNLTKYISKI